MKLGVWRCLFLVIIVVITAIHITAFASFTIDDAYITFAYCRNIVHGHGFVFSPGDRVEATSSMLWTAVLVPFEFLLSDGAITGSKILGVTTILMTGVTGCMLISLLTRKCAWRRQLYLLYLFLIGSSSCYIQWCMYGMENGLVAFLLIVSCVFFTRESEKGQGFLSALPVFLLDTVRPEGFIYVIVFVLWRAFLAFGGTARSRRWFIIWGIALLVGVIPYELFGWVYYGHILPNTVTAKVGVVDCERILKGLTYILNFNCRRYLFLFLLALTMVAIFMIRGFRTWGLSETLSRYGAPRLLVVSLVLVHYAFVVAVGGDWMINARFLSSVVPLILALFVATAYTACVSMLPSGWLSPKRVPVLLLAGLLLLFRFSLPNVKLSRMARNYAVALEISEERAIRGMAQLLNQLSFSKMSTVACSDVGRIGYYFSGRTIDWAGLADEQIARTRDSVRRAGIVFERKPEFLVLYSTEPVLSAGSMDKGMACCSQAFWQYTALHAEYSQVASLFFGQNKIGGARWHVLFQRKKMGEPSAGAN